MCVHVLLSSVIRDNLLLSSKAHDLRRSLDQLQGNPTLTTRREAMTGMQASSLSGGAVGMLLSCAICKLIMLPPPNLNKSWKWDEWKLRRFCEVKTKARKKICMVIKRYYIFFFFNLNFDFILLLLLLLFFFNILQLSIYMYMNI